MNTTARSVPHKSNSIEEKRGSNQRTGDRYGNRRSGIRCRRWSRSDPLSSSGSRIDGGENSYNQKGLHDANLSHCFTPSIGKYIYTKNRRMQTAEIVLEFQWSDSIGEELFYLYMTRFFRRGDDYWQLLTEHIDWMIVREMNC